MTPHARAAIVACNARRRLKTAVAVCLVFVLLPAALALAQRSAATLDPAQVADLFSQSKELFRRADRLAAEDPQGAVRLYRRAALRLERIVAEGGVASGRLYYNIGNAYFRIKDIGRAILNYRRAAQYIPNDPNLQQNLQAARERRRDAIAAPATTQVTETLFFWHHDFSTSTRLAVFAAAFGLLWLLAAIHLVRPRDGLKWGLFICLLVAVPLGGSLAVEQVELLRHRPGVVLAPEVIARKGNGKSYARSFTDALHAGVEFLLVETRGDWLHIELPDGRRCWVPAVDVGLVR